jgi:hypothetical protein
LGGSGINYGVVRWSDSIMCVGCLAIPSDWLPLDPVSGVVIGGIATTVAAGSWADAATAHKAVIAVRLGNRRIVIVIERRSS